MKFVLATSDDLEHRYVANTLAAVLGDNLVGVLIERRPTSSLTLSRMRKIRKRYGIFRIVERVTTKFVRKLLNQSRRQQAALQEILGSAPMQVPEGCEIQETASINARDSIAWLQRMDPAVLLVYGTSVIRQPALSTAHKFALNLHTGISPYYRGSGTVFWPLYQGEPSMVGATVHQCTSDLDGGRIYRTVQADLSEDDDAFSAFAKSVRSGAVVYAEVAAQLAAGKMPEGQRQDLDTGREYFFRDLTFVQELVMECRVRTGALRRLIAQCNNEYKKAR